MVFLHGTTITEENGVDLPIRSAAKKIQTWKERGAVIVYLTHRMRPEDVRKQRLMLIRHGFPDGPIYYRKSDETYSEVAERVNPDVLVEDDCVSIGGEKEMTYPGIRPDLKTRIKSIVVKEGGGIDHLPDELANLMAY